MSTQQPVSPIYYTYAHPPVQYHDPSFASLAFRPVQLPYQHQLASPVEQQQLRPTYQQPFLVEAAPGFTQHFQQTGPTVRNQTHPYHHLPFRPRGQHQQARVMADSDYQRMTEEQLAEFQKQSNEYQPEAVVCPKS